MYREVSQNHNEIGIVISDTEQCHEIINQKDTTDIETETSELDTERFHNGTAKIDGDGDWVPSRIVDVDKNKTEIFLVTESMKKSHYENNILSEKLDNHGIHNCWNKNHGPHQVFVSINVEIIRNVDTANQTFECRFTLTEQWMMSAKDKEYFTSAKGRITDNWKPEWSPPKIKFPGATGELKIETPKLSVKQLDAMRLWHQVTTVEGKFTEPLELMSFPFDFQDLSIEMIWPEPDSVMSTYAIDNSSLVTIFNDNSSLSEWTVYPPIVEFFMHRISNIAADFSLTFEKRPALLLRLKVGRVYSPYLFQVFLVLGLISVCTLVSFMPDPADSSGRISQATTMLLTIVAFQFVVSSMLPKLNYLTLIDKYILSCTFFVAAVLFQVGIETLLITHFSVDVTIEQDSYLLLANATVLLSYNIYFIVDIIYRVLPQERIKIFNHTDTSTDEIKNIFMKQINNLMLSSTAVKLGGVKEARKDYTVMETLTNRFVYSPTVSQTIKIDDSVSTKFTSSKKRIKRGTFPSGIFSCDYGHGSEYFNCYTLSSSIKGKKSKLCFRKITGDAYVPAGKISLMIDGIPEVGGEKLSTRLRYREDIYDVNGFKWKNSFAHALSDNEIFLDDGTTYRRVITN